MILCKNTIVLSGFHSVIQTKDMDGLDPDLYTSLQYRNGRMVSILGLLVNAQT